MAKIINGSTFTFAGFTYNAFESGKFNKVEVLADGKTKSTNIGAAVYNEAKAQFDAEQAAKANTENTEGTNNAENTDTGAENTAPAPKKDRTHPTSDTFLAKMPENTYIFERNNKGHIRIFKKDGDKTAYAKLCPKKDGVNICPSKALREAKADVAWVYHEGWASKYAYKAKDWDEVATILDLEQA